MATTIKWTRNVDRANARYCYQANVRGAGIIIRHRPDGWRIEYDGSFLAARFENLGGAKAAAVKHHNAQAASR